MKKLSPAQQRVIDIASERPSYIVNTPYEHLQKIISVEPFDHPYDGDKTYKTHTMGYFYLSTFRVLLRLGLITPTDIKDYYKLTTSCTPTSIK